MNKNPCTGPKIWTPTSDPLPRYFTYMPINKPNQEAASAVATAKNNVNTLDTTSPNFYIL